MANMIKSRRSWSDDARHGINAAILETSLGDMLVNLNSLHEEWLLRKLKLNVSYYLLSNDNLF